MESLDAEPSAANAKHILVVDDEPNVIRLIQVNLERQGYMVDTAGNGMEALAKIKINRPDLLITDVMMPELGGFDLISVIRSDASVKGIPIIILGWRTQTYTPDPKQFLRTGADRVVFKPFSPMQLISAVDELLHSN